MATRLLLGWKQERLPFFITPTLLHPCCILLHRRHPTLYTLSLSRYTLFHPDYTLLCPVTPCYNPVTPCYNPVTPCYPPLEHSVMLRYTRLHPCSNPFTPYDTTVVPCHTSLHFVTPLFHPWSPRNLVTLVALITLITPETPKRAATRTLEGPRLDPQEAPQLDPQWHIRNIGQISGIIPLNTLTSLTPLS